MTSIQKYKLFAILLGLELGFPGVNPKELERLGRRAIEEGRNRDELQKAQTEANEVVAEVLSR